MSSAHISLEWLQAEFRILRLSLSAELPHALLNLPDVTISKSRDEVSVLLPAEAEIQIDALNQSAVLVGFRVTGFLDHGLIGILARLSKVLAEAEVPIFAISTFDTDYIYVDAELKSRAQAALEARDYKFL